MEWARRKKAASEALGKRDKMPEWGVGGGEGVTCTALTSSSVGARGVGYIVTFATGGVVISRNVCYRKWS